MVFDIAKTMHFDYGLLLVLVAEHMASLVATLNLALELVVALEQELRGREKTNFFVFFGFGFGWVNVFFQHRLVRHRLVVSITNQNQKPQKSRLPISV